VVSDRANERERERETQRTHTRLLSSTSLSPSPLSRPLHHQHNADFSSSLLDRTQQQALCRYADGKNPTTGVETRASLGCGSRRRRLESTPSNPEGPAVRAEDKDAFVSSMPVYRK